MFKMHLYVKSIYSQIYIQLTYQNIFDYNENEGNDAFKSSGNYLY
jgi:hypothetical protein